MAKNNHTTQSLMWFGKNVYIHGWIQSRISTCLHPWVNTIKNFHNKAYKIHKCEFQKPKDKTLRKTQRTLHKNRYCFITTTIFHTPNTPIHPLYNNTHPTKPYNLMWVKNPKILSKTTFGQQTWIGSKYGSKHWQGSARIPKRLIHVILRITQIGCILVEIKTISQHGNILSIYFKVKAIKTGPDINSERCHLDHLFALKNWKNHWNNLTVQLVGVSVLFSFLLLFLFLLLFVPQFSWLLANIMFSTEPNRKCVRFIELALTAGPER